MARSSTAATGEQGPRPVWRAARASGVGALLAAALAGCQIGVLHPRGPVGEAQKAILSTSVLIMLAIVVPTIVATLAVAWWFRAGNGRARYRPDWAYSGRLELVTWSIPLLVILLLGGIAWIGSHQLDPARPLASREEPTEVEVVSLDWKWLFILPRQGVASVNRLVVPAGRPIAFKLTSGSVLNVFFVPQLGSMIYTMNGMATRLHLQADQEGTFEGLSAHFSGDGFPGMRFSLDAVSPGAFEGWVAEARRSEAVLDRAAYEALARPSANVSPGTYRNVDADLFAAIVSQQIPPAPGPGGSATASLPQPDWAGPICTPAAPRGVGLAAMGRP